MPLQCLFIWTCCANFYDMKICKGEWSQMPRRVRCSPLSRRNKVSYRYANIFYVKLKSRLHNTQKKSLLSRILVRGDRRSFYFLLFSRWIGFKKIYKISYVFLFVFYLIQLPVWAVHFLTFRLCSDWFFAYANNASGRRLWEIFTLGIFYSWVSR